MPIATPRLLGLATRVPRHRLHQDEVVSRAMRLFPDLRSGALAHLLPVFANAGIRTRYFCAPPEWYEKPHGWAEKNALFLDHALDLLEGASRDALDEAGRDVTDIDCVVSISTTGLATPSLDARLMGRLGMRRNVERVPIFGLGCAGGVLGLARAGTFASMDKGRTVLLVVVELCGLTFRRQDQSKSNIVASALFGDGAAAAVISPSGQGPALEVWGEHTWSDSLDVMGWSVEDDGLGVVFSRDIPSLVRNEFRAAAHDFLHAHGLSVGEIDAFVCHPGGAKVIEALEEAFDLAPGALEASRAVLGEYGNMSAATVLFVLQRVLASGCRGRYLLSSLGPGFTAAFLTMRTG